VHDGAPEQMAVLLQAEALIAAQLPKTQLLTLSYNRSQPGLHLTALVIALSPAVSVLT
jgi:hypothetical protein